MVDVKRNTKFEYFFTEFKEENSVIILAYILASFTLYVIYWLYQINLKLLEVDDDAPNPNRAISVLLILPSIWFLITYFFKRFILNVEPSHLLTIYWDKNLSNFSLSTGIIGIVEFVGWLLIIILILKYFYDFSVSYGRISKSPFLIWYIFLSSEVFGFIFFLLGIDILYILSFVTIIGIPAMQERLNYLAHKYKIESQKKLNYMFGSGG